MPDFIMKVVIVCCELNFRHMIFSNLIRDDQRTRRMSLVIYVESFKISYDKRRAHNKHFVSTKPTNHLNKSQTDYNRTSCKRTQSRTILIKGQLKFFISSFINPSRALGFNRLCAKVRWFESLQSYVFLILNLASRVYIGQCKLLLQVFLQGSHITLFTPL